MNSEARSYWYHAHVGALRATAFRGPLVIREEEEDHSNEFIVMLQDWYHAPLSEIVRGLLQRPFRCVRSPLLTCCADLPCIRAWHAL